MEMGFNMEKSVSSRRKQGGGSLADHATAKIPEKNSHRQSPLGLGRKILS